MSDKRVICLHVDGTLEDVGCIIVATEDGRSIEVDLENCTVCLYDSPEVQPVSLEVH